MEWLKENGLLKEGAEIGDLAFDYAIRYEQPHVVDAFRHVARISVSHRSKVDLNKKSPVKLSKADAEAASFEEKRVREVTSHEARSLAILVAGGTPA